MARQIKRETLDSEVHKAWQSLTTSHEGDKRAIEEGIARFVMAVNNQVQRVGMDSFRKNNGLVCALVEKDCKALPPEVAGDADRIRRKIQRKLSTGRLQWGHVEHPKYKALPGDYVETMEAMRRQLSENPTSANPDFLKFAASTAAEYAVDLAGQDPATSALFAAAAGESADLATRSTIIGRLEACIARIEPTRENMGNLVGFFDGGINELEQLIAELDDHALVTYAEIIEGAVALFAQTLDVALGLIRTGEINEDFETLQAFQQRLDAITARIGSASVRIN